jgi:ribonuclease-3
MAAKRGDLSALETSLGHQFADRDLALLALTHVSATAARDTSYQRLEFLGDRILGLAVTAMLYESFATADEGELSRRLADLVRRESCAEVAHAWGVENHVRLGDSERQAGVVAKETILADVCESLIGAVFLDAGYEAAKDVVVRAFAPRMRAPRRPLRDPKTALQEWAQARGLEVPRYREARRTGPDHAPEFDVEVIVAGFAPSAAKGGSKRAAEQAAAFAFLTREGIASERT